MKAPRPTIVGRRRPDRAPRRPRVGRRVHTPGHTDDHLCLYDPDDGVLLSGDHVLPTITPHIGGFTGGDPLANYLVNLDKVADLQGITLVLPAHGHPFDDLAGRCHAIKDHHASRLETLADARRRLGWAGVTRWSHELFTSAAGGRWPTARRSPTSSTSGSPMGRAPPGHVGYEYRVLT